MREAELKHGRVSMLAVVGWLVQAHGIHLPSDTGLYDTANPIDAVFHVGAGPLLQIVLGVGALEWLNHDGKMTMVDMHEGSSRVPGEFTNPIYGAKQLKGKSESQVADIKLKELKNGRLAMMAIGGLVHQTIVTGSETFGTFPNPQLYGL
jgi:light-harvesting complex I chlorophyll a/b binding protein 4